jgi:hypothetical protein
VAQGAGRVTFVDLVRASESVEPGVY